MLAASRLAFCARSFGRTVSLARHLSVGASQKTDPIQKLFIDKIHEYTDKSKSGGGQLVDATAEIEKSLKDDLEKLSRQFNVSGQDFTKFPSFTFTDGELESVGVSVDIKDEILDEDAKLQQQQETEDDDKPYFEP